MAGKNILDDELLDEVVGGLFKWNPNTMMLKYIHDDGSETYYKVLDFQKGWELSNNLTGQFMDEDKIIARLIAEKYIEG